MHKKIFELIIFQFILLISIIYIINTFPKENKTIASDEPNIIDIGTIEVKDIYLILGEEYELTLDNDVSYNYIYDEEIISINNNLISTKNSGTTEVTISYYDESSTFNVYVTDLLSISTLNNDKDYLTCNLYSDEDNELIDNVLAFKISEVGNNTRAGVVEAARFLTLNFPYKISYFYENGRLETNGERTYADGEGRYYHTGLYLSNKKTSSIIASVYGPTTWGCSLYSKITKVKSKNGLDCSGFVTWAILNGGFDIGDVGSGYYDSHDNDLDDLGNKLSINETVIKSSKVGDLITRNGHVGIIIGIDYNTYYIAESLDYSLHINEYDLSSLLSSDWTDIIDMSSVYLEDGNLTNMW